MSILTQDQRNMSKLHNQIQYFNNDPLIPSDLRITINTGVPGFQSIIYKPQMSIPDTKEKKIWFTPLVRLNQRIVDQVPAEYRIKQFFNKGLYESLLRYHGIVPIKKEDHELEDAERGAEIAAKNVSLAEKKVEKAERRVAAAENAARRTNIGPEDEFEEDDELARKSLLSTIGEETDDEGSDEEQNGGAWFDGLIDDEYTRRTNADYKKYLTPDEYKQYIKNKNLSIKGSDGKRHKFYTNESREQQKNFRVKMNEAKKADVKKKLEDAEAANKAKLAKLESDLLAKNVADAKKAVDASNALAKKAADKKAAENKKSADKKAADKKAYEKIISEFDAANVSLASAEEELKQKQSDKNASDTHLRRIKAAKSDPDKNKASAKADAVWALNEAKTRGNFNNNIKVTLDTLFKNGSVLYIDKKPYVIVDTQMIQGDWSLDVKPAEMATIYHTSQSNIYDKAEQVRRVELETAGLTSFTGENWVDRYPQFDKKYSVTTLKPGNGQNTEEKNTGVLRIEDAKKTSAIVPRRQGSSFSDSFFDSKNPHPNPKPNPKLLTDEIKRPPTSDEVLIYKLFDVYRITYTQYFRRYFGADSDTKNTKCLNDITYTPRMKGYKNKIILAKNRNFFRIVRQMYDNLIKQNTEEKNTQLSNKIRRDFELYSRHKSSKSQPGLLTETNYIDVIRSINLYDNIGAGDCFFDAIAQALNLHNLNIGLQKGKEKEIQSIVSQLIPSTQCSDKTKKYEFFDQMCIREIVKNKMISTFDDLIKKYFAKETDDKTRLTYNNELEKILVESNIDGKKFTALLMKEKNITKNITDIVDANKQTMEKYLMTSNYWGTNVTMEYLNKASLDAIGIKLRVVTIIQEDAMKQYTIDTEFNDTEPDEHLIFLYNLRRRHYLLMTFKDNKNIDHSIFKIEEIPFVFLCYIVIFMMTMMGSQAFEGSLVKFDIMLDIANSLASVVRSNNDYKLNACLFFNKKDGLCAKTSEDVVNRAKDELNKRSEKKKQVTSPRKLYDTRSNVNKAAKIKDKEGGSPYYQYGGLNEVEKHREDYQRNNYTRYPGIPVAYPVDSTITRVEEIDKSISSVFVTIDLELHKGKTISNSELASSKCNHQYNAIKHSFAVLTGTPYIIAPVYGGTRRNRRSNVTHKKRRNVRNITHNRRNVKNKTRKRS
uniref:OTU domain-containing protein n=1 Tax=viral metagenome TaxID=1070528 RepID=A0A6C0E718_9ZZZZ